MNTEKQLRIPSEAGQRLKQYRTEHGFQQDTIAQVLSRLYDTDCRQHHIARWERGTTHPRRVWTWRIMNFLARTNEPYVKVLIAEAALANQF